MGRVRIVALAAEQTRHAVPSCQSPHDAQQLASKGRLAEVLLDDSPHIAISLRGPTTADMRKHLTAMCGTLSTLELEKQQEVENELPKEIARLGERVPRCAACRNLVRNCRAASTGGKSIEERTFKLSVYMSRV